MSRKLKQGRGAVGKQPVLGIRERAGKVNAIVLDGTRLGDIQPTIYTTVEKGSALYTDEYKNHDRLNGLRCGQYRVKHSTRPFVDRQANTNVRAVVKHSHFDSGTYQNRSKKPCQAYINEFTFCLNEDKVKQDTQHRLHDLFRATSGKEITNAEFWS